MKLILLAVMLLLAIVPASAMWSLSHQISGDASQEISDGIKAEL